MKFDDLLRIFGEKAWFDFEMVLVMSGEDAASVHTELYRWRRAGKVLELRRGMFTLAEPWRHSRFDAACLAGPLYPPSYLSGRWLLTRCGALAAGAAQSDAMQSDAAGVTDVAGAADMVGTSAEFTSVTSRPGCVFENAFGRYTYATLPRDLLFGSVSEEIGESRVRVALPEKALLDFCFISGGEWDEARFEAAGVHHEPLDLRRLEGLAARAGRPRLVRAAGSFLWYAGRRGAGLSREDTP